MPIWKEYNLHKKGQIIIWSLEEDRDFFENKLELTSDESQYLASLSDRKAMEWLCSHYLIHMMSGRRDRILVNKDDFGKPFLDQSDWFISLSHSKDKVAVIASPVPVGIDIQIITEKIERIAHKFMSEEEFTMLDENYRLEHLHIFWGAKESLYKIYGRKKLLFREHINVLCEKYHNDRLFSFSGTVKKGGFSGSYDLFAERLENFILVYGLEKD